MQPPSGGCVLKQECMRVLDDYGTQPPSGGCVLKPIALFWRGVGVVAATFGWLCVETRLCSQLNLNTLCSHLRVAVC